MLSLYSRVCYVVRPSLRALLRLLVFYYLRWILIVISIVNVDITIIVGIGICNRKAIGLNVGTIIRAIMRAIIRAIIRTIILILILILIPILILILRTRPPLPEAAASDYQAKASD